VVLRFVVNNDGIFHRIFKTLICSLLNTLDLYTCWVCTSVCTSVSQSVRFNSQCCIVNEQRAMKNLEKI